MEREQLIYFIKYVIDDMREPLSYIPGGLLWGLLFAAAAALSGIREVYRGGQFHWKRPAFFFLLGIYLYVFLEQAWFSRAPGSRTGVNMEIFGVWNNSLRDKAYMVENLMMFIPFGVLIPACFRKAGTLWAVLPLSFSASVCLEYMQFITARGHCQLDDVLMNTAGGVLGYVLFRMVPVFLKKI
ncbi:MAG: VanZ family protein [Eubacteriales bacterium]|nr:VanZ family protein [Eubacteriales bacterium]